MKSINSKSVMVFTILLSSMISMPLVVNGQGTTDQGMDFDQLDAGIFQGFQGGFGALFGNNLGYAGGVLDLEAFAQEDEEQVVSCSSSLRSMPPSSTPRRRGRRCTSPPCPSTIPLPQQRDVSTSKRSWRSPRAGRRRVCSPSTVPEPTSTPSHRTNRPTGS